tara:strand:- start:239 stop:601 length:363 start_codon:yes stop_codon:yes gene_type:complete
MTQSVPFAASTGGKIANGTSAMFFAAMAAIGLQSEANDFDLLFISTATLAICGFINAITLSLEEYPKEALAMTLLVPWIAGPLLAWTHIAGGGAQWKALTWAAFSLVFLFFLVKPPKWRM